MALLPAAMAARLRVLAREVGMLAQVQPHLKGCAARQNQARIAARREEAETLTSYIALVARVGMEEMVRCDIADLN